jgi:uncharacterized protein (TIGR03083 family)
MSEVWEVIRAERRALVDELEGLTPAEWSTPSLCTGWTVQDVAAHLAWASALSPGALLVELGRAGLRPNRFLADSAVRWSRRGTASILEQLRLVAARDAKPLGMPQDAVLVDAVVHGLDVRRPLGRTRVLGPLAFHRTADFCAGARFPSSMLLGGQTRRRLEGVRLVAEDQDWSTGQGAEVRAPAEVVLLVLAGRPVRPDELTGPGAATLAARL